jgi:hypothetical protein
VRLLTEIPEPKSQQDDLDNSCSFVSVVKSRITLDGNTCQNAALWIPERIWEDNIRMDF